MMIRMLKKLKEQQQQQQHQQKETTKQTNKQKERVIKRIPKFNDYKNCFFKNEIILKSQQRFKSEGHCIYTEEVNKIALSSNDDERLQIFDRIRTYPYGLNVFKVCKIEMLSKYKWLILIIIITKTKELNSKWPHIPDHP